MKKVAILFFCGLELLTSCNKEPNSKNVSDVRDSSQESSASNDPPLKPDTESTSSRYSIIYSDSLKIHDKKLRVDTSSSIINRSANLVGYKINSLTQGVMRICAEKKDRREVNQLVIEDRQYPWDKRHGFPNEFVGDYVFSDRYRGAGTGGSITKFKFRILKNELEFVDSILGGS